MSSDLSVVQELAPHPPLVRYYASAGEKRAFVREIFDETAGDYDRIERAMALGTGSWYRRQALRRARLDAGMRVLDVAVGTGLVAREAAKITGDPQLVLGIDPSAGMLAQATRRLSIRVTQGTGERLPIASDSFDFLSMGYALRHLSNLTSTFAEFHRVLKSGGRICLLEITRPRGRLRTSLLSWYMRGMSRLATGLAGRSRQSPLLWQYYWDTIDACVPPDTVIHALEHAGFVNVRRHVELGIFSEYTGSKL